MVVSTIKISCYFNPRAPHGGATTRRSLRAIEMPFQSTRPAWGRDPKLLSLLHRGENFNPRAPHGGATVAIVPKAGGFVISIHAPRMGARPRTHAEFGGDLAFQSTRPAWGRDDGQYHRPHQQRDFNPRAPHGGATEGEPFTVSLVLISIHAPRMGARHVCSGFRPHVAQFQSTRPAWGRDERFRSSHRNAEISIHAPRMGARLAACPTLFVAPYFNPRARKS